MTVSRAARDFALAASSRRKRSWADSASEEQIHKAVIRYLQVMHADGVACIRHSGGWRHPTTAARLQVMGTRAGVPDIVLHLPSGRGLPSSS